MTIRHIILSAIGLFLTTGCQTKHNSDKSDQTSNSSNQSKPANHSLSGKWIDNNIAWYIATLTLNDDGTFSFHDQGHYGQNFTEGKWIETSGTITLKSFRNFQKDIKINHAGSKKVYMHGTTPISKKDKEYNSIPLTKVPPPTIPGTKDTIRIFFDNIQLKLQNDTLHSIGVNKLGEASEFHKIQNNR